MAKLVRLWEDESGASAAEYALILAIIGGAVAVSAYALGSSIATSMNRTSNCINATTASACS